MFDARSRTRPSQIHPYSKDLISISVSRVGKIHARPAPDLRRLKVAHGWLAKILGPLIPVAVQHPQGEGNYDACGRCGDQRNLRRVVIRGILGSEGLRSDDVCDTESCCDDCASSNLSPVSTEMEALDTNAPFSCILCNSHQRLPRSTRTEQRTRILSIRARV
jgi:hypothetical protein